jgi:hypothetical protein
MVISYGLGNIELMSSFRTHLIIIFSLLVRSLNPAWRSVGQISGFHAGICPGTRQTADHRTRVDIYWSFLIIKSFFPSRPRAVLPQVWTNRQGESMGRVDDETRLMAAWVPTSFSFPSL